MWLQHEELPPAATVHPEVIQAFLASLTFFSFLFFPAAALT